MIRRKPLRRAPWRRRQPDQPRARGRATASPEQWQAIRDVVLARAGWRCQACGRGGRLDVHHVVKRSQGRLRLGSRGASRAVPALSRPDRCVVREGPIARHPTGRRPVHVRGRHRPPPVGAMPPRCRGGALTRPRRAAAEPLARLAPPLMLPKQLEIESRSFGRSRAPACFGLERQR